MLQANELRLGNFIRCYNCTIQIASVSWNWVTDNNTLDGQFDVDDCEGIPLTPEILEACGYVWNEECKSYEYKDLRMNLQYRELNGSYTMFNYVLRAKIADSIFYLHQLQNLYFALTGTELLYKQI